MDDENKTTVETILAADIKNGIVYVRAYDVQQWLRDMAANSPSLSGVHSPTCLVIEERLKQWEDKIKVNAS